MRIAIANADICVSKGGSERAAIRLAEEMMKRGHDTRILTVRAEESPLYDIDPQIPVHFFPNSFFKADPKAFLYGADLLLKNKVDVLISFESDYKHVFWGKFCREVNIPHVCSERNTPFFIENELWNRPARRTFLHTCAGIHELLIDYQQYVPEEDRERVFVAPNAIPAVLPGNFSARLPENPVLLYLGRFVRQKRLLLLLDAFSLLSNEFPAWSLCFAGWGNEEDLLLKMREERRLENKVEIRHIYGHVNLEYLAASIFCLPSLYEGFPNTVLEAMGNGLPIVGIKDCLAMNSIIRQGETGILAEKPTPESLAEALHPLMASYDERIRMGKNAWKECRREYSPAIIFNKWESELKKIVNQSYE